MTCGTDKTREHARVAGNRDLSAAVVVAARDSASHDEPVTEFRARLDGTITFSNGGAITVEDFRLDLPSADTSHDEIGRLLVSSLGLLMADKVDLTAIDILEEPHKGTRGGPSGRPRDVDMAAGSRQLVELSHPITAGMVTLPGLPGPEITPHLTREASKQIYAEGTTFEIARISMVANTGTYVDSPHHRFESGTDLAGLPLERLAELPTVVCHLEGSAVRGITPEALAAYDVAGCAVLLHTGDDVRFGTPDYVVGPSYLTREGAAWLIARGAVLVGIDAANIDDMTDGTRPAHTALLDAGIPIVEHLTGLGQLPARGARFTAAAPRVVGFGTFPVRAFAAVPLERPADVAYETERCWVRSWRADDAERVLDIYSRWEVARWLGSEPKVMEGMEAAERLVSRWSELNDTDEIAGRWAVERKSDGVVLGVVILVPLPDGDGEFEVGWHFHPDAWGGGYASETARAAVAWGFDHGLSEIWAVVRPDNAASIAVCRRIGMTAEGLTTKYYDAELELFHIAP
jgi:arylformamidase